MKKLILVFGIVAGVATSMLDVLWDYEAYVQRQYLPAEAMAYAYMILVPIVLFFAIRICRENYFGGTITWTRGLILGLSVSLLASIVHVIGVKLLSSLIMPHFWSDFATRSLRALDSTTRREVTKNLKESIYDHPIYYGLGRPFLKILAPGVVFAPICALLLRKKLGVAPTKELHAESAGNLLYVVSDSPQVFDAFGRKYTLPIYNGTLDISSLPPGVYYVEQGEQHTRFMKE